MESAIGGMESTVGGMESMQLVALYGIKTEDKGRCTLCVMPYARWAIPYNSQMRIDAMHKPFGLEKKQPKSKNPI